ncbi:hypothetical protein JTB14_005253 [Gonioctena quinquepunctata]|nr:hypothetical protein JTB14_005253 [Gonioctena quinquepunctata]
MNLGKHCTSLSDTEDPQYIQPNLRNDHNGASSDSDSSDSEPIERDRPVSEISLSSSLMHRSTRSTRVSRRRRGHRAPTRVRNTSVRSNGTSAQLVNNEWTGNFTPIEKPLFQPRYKKEDCRLWTPEDYFKQYINDEMLEITVVASNRTYLEKKGSELRLTTKELKVFIGVLFVMSTIDLPQIKIFWTKKYGVAIIKNAITRNRFCNIRTSLKVVYDPEVGDAEKANKIWKVMPLFRSILRGCQAQIRTDNISIDGMIIPFTGHCGIRQFCPRKPNPIGINIFLLANPNGIVCDMTVYQGDSTFSADLIQQGFSLGESAFISLCDTLVPGHHIYFDRYFTTIKLADVLLERGFHATGTIIQNRIPRNCIFSPEKLFVKNPRGTTETKVRGDGIITIHRWLDNKPVTILSTCHAAKNPDQCRRWSKRKKEYEMVSRPEVIRNYNQFMGGVDLADRMLAGCPSRSRTRKCTIRFISHMLDLAVCNSWFQYRETQIEKKIPTKHIFQLRFFKLALGEQLISDNTLSSDSESSSNYEELEPKH